MIDGVFGRIKRLWDTIINAIKSTVTNIWDKVTSIATTLVGLGTSIVSAIWSKLEGFSLGPISDLFTAVSDVYNYLMTTLWNTLSTIYTEIRSIASKIPNIPDLVYEKIKSVFDEFPALLAGIPDIVYSKLSGLLDSIYQHISVTFTSIWQEITYHLNQVWDKIEEIPNKVKGAFQFVYDELVSGFEGLWGYVKDIGSYLKDLGSDIAHWIWDKLSPGLTKIFSGAKKMLESFWKYIKPLITKTIPALIAPFLNWIADQVANLFVTMFDKLKVIVADKPPEDASLFIKTVMRLAAPLVGFSAAHALAGSVTPFHDHGMKAMSTIMYRFANYDKWVSAVQYPIAQVAVQIPFSYTMNAMFTPKIPDFGQILAMRAKHEIPYAELEQLMAWHGFNKTWALRFERYLWKDPRLFEILYLADTGFPLEKPSGKKLLEELTEMEIPHDEKFWWPIFKLMKAGYEDADIPNLLTVIIRRIIKGELGDMRVHARYLYTNGYITEEQFLENIKALDVEPRWAGITMQYLRSKRTALFQREKAHALADAYRDMIIDGTEFYDEMIGLGFQHDYILQRQSVHDYQHKFKIERAAMTAAERAEEKERRENVAIVNNQYKEGILDYEETYEILIALGEDEDITRKKLEIIKLRRTAKSHATAVKETEKVILKERNEKIKLILEQYKLDTITYEIAQSQLEELGLTPLYTTTKLDIIKLRKESSEKEVETEPTETKLSRSEKAKQDLILRQFETTRITQGEAEMKLLKLKLSGDYIIAKLKIITLRKEEAEKRELAREQETDQRKILMSRENKFFKLYELDAITRSKAEMELRKLELANEYITAKLDLLTQRKSEKLRKVEIKTIEKTIIKELKDQIQITLDEFWRGEITEDIVRSEFQQLGLTDIYIEARIHAEKMRKEAREKSEELLIEEEDYA
jgi:PHD/YefM family antitoxin component YafN of YafNO toxin-antitoxin module